MFTTIEDLLHYNNIAIINTAKIAVELKNNLESTRIDKEEYDDLSADLLNLARIDKLASTIEDKALVKEAFDFLRVFLGVLGK